MLFVFLDDIREPTNYKKQYFDRAVVQEAIARNMTQFTNIITEHVDELHNMTISLDHDLATFQDDNVEVTGYDCLKWLMQLCVDHKPIKLPVVYVHSWNVVAVPRMIETWRQFKFDYYDGRFNDTNQS